MVGTALSIRAYVTDTEILGREDHEVCRRSSSHSPTGDQVKLTDFRCWPIADMMSASRNVRLGASAHLEGPAPFAQRGRKGRG
jgi:hypothetical protein